MESAYYIAISLLVIVSLALIFLKIENNVVVKRRSGYKQYIFKDRALVWRFGNWKKLYMKEAAMFQIRPQDPSHIVDRIIFVPLFTTKTIDQVYKSMDYEMYPRRALINYTEPIAELVRRILNPIIEKNLDKISSIPLLDDYSVIMREIWDEFCSDVKNQQGLDIETQKIIYQIHMERYTKSGTLLPL